MSSDANQPPEERKMKLFASYLLILCVIFGASLAENPSDLPNVITRSAWNAEPARSVSYLIIPLPYVVIHHTVTPQCLSVEDCSARVKNIQNYHMNDLRWDDVGYSFFIGGDGNVYEGVGWNKEGAHTYKWNKKSAGIAFIGNFQDTEPSQKMLNAARQLINRGKAEGFLRSDVKILGGRQVISSLSPGDKLYSKIQQWSEWTASP